MNYIKAERLDIEYAREQLTQRMLKLQEECMHNRVFRHYRSDENDSGRTVYWVDITCEDCNKFWRQ